MVAKDSAYEQALVAWQALQAWLSRDEEGRLVLERFQADPQGQALELTKWLQAHSAQAPPQLAAYISGGQVERLVNIAQAGVVQITLPPAPPSGPYQLPPDIADFTGRGKELDQVMAHLTQAVEGQATALVISAVAGMAGVGKSALAIHAAHALKERFPDAWLYVNLRGAEGQPLDPLETLAGFLRALGIEDRFMPKDLEGRAGLYRSKLADKRALVLLDNAQDEAQVRPLLPGGPTCAVLVTSRRRLSALEGAAILDLEVMSEEEALELLGRLAGSERVRAEPKAAAKIVRLCGRLPLAVRIAGGKLKGRPDWRLEEYATRLADERGRLKKLRLGDLDVRASFALSYQDLPSEDARLFRRLGLLAGPDFAPEVAIPLLEADPEAAREAVERLEESQLLEPAGEGRYRFHDLVRLFARERLEEEPTEEQEAARLRAARWLAVQARMWDNLLTPSEERRAYAAETVEKTGRKVEEVERALTLAALTAFDRERENLLAAVEWAYNVQEWGLVTRLSANLVNFFDIRSLWADWEQVGKKAVEASKEMEDKWQLGAALNRLASVYQRQGKWPEAAETYKRALCIARELGERGRQGEAVTLMNLGSVYLRQGRWNEAIGKFEESLRIRRELSDRHGEGQTLMNLGNVYAQQGRWEEAIECYEKDLAICRELGDRHGEGKTLMGLGNVYADLGRWDEAMECYKESLRILQELKAYPDLVICHRQMASLSLRADDSSACFDHLAQALGLALQIHPKLVVDTIDRIVDIAKGLGDKGRWEEVAALGGELFKLVMEMEKEGWKNKGLEAVGVLARRVCAVIALAGKSRLEEVPEEERVEARETALAMARMVDGATCGRWGLEEWVGESVNG